MIKKHFGGKTGYDIFIGKDLLKEIAGLFPFFDRKKILIVTDDGVPSLYYESVRNALKKSAPEVYTVVIPGGEENKNPENVRLITDSLVSHLFNRTDCIVSVGGGIVCDTAGFAAACYMRGIDFYNVPTTLLSQADSSVGGKTGVNYGGIKNLIGAFRRPRGVLIDVSTLDTLPERHISNGMSEIIKMSAIFDARLFREIQKIPDEFIISSAIDIKICVVEKDEYESCLRRSLNFGHTIGHGIELNSDLLHGEAVGVGMLAMSGGEARKRIEEKLLMCGLPVSVKINADDVMDAVMHDKKSYGDGIRCILCDNIGTFYEKTIGEKELKERLCSVTG